MAQGTGLGVNIKSGNVRTTTPKIIDGDQFSNAKAWGEIAADGERISKVGFDALQKEEHQRRVGYLADQEIEIARQRADLRDQNSEDPQGFDAAWKGYTEGKLSQAPPWAVNHLKTRLGAEGNSAYSGILSERRAKDYRLDVERINSLVHSSGNDVVGAGMAGTLGSPDGALKIDRFRNQLQAGVTAGLIPQEKADLLFDEKMGQAQGEVAARSGVDVYKQQGFDAAVGHLKRSILENENLSLKGETRYKAFNRGLTAIRLEQQRDKEDRADLVQISKDLRARIEASQPVDEGEVRDVLGNLARAGAAAEHRQLSVAYGVAAATAPYRDGLNVRDFARSVSQMRMRAGSPEEVGAITGTAQRLGISPRDLAAAISYETAGRFDPNIQGGKGGNYLGLIQFGPEERATYGVRPGMSFQEQMGAVEAYLRDRGVKPGMGLSDIYRTINGGNPNVSLNASDGNATIGQHIQRIERDHYAAADRFLGGTAASPEQALGLPPTGEIEKRVQKVFVEQVRKAWPDFKQKLDAGKVLDDEDITALRYAAALSGDASWIQQVDEATVGYKLAGATAGLGPSGRQNIVDQARQQLGENVATHIEKRLNRDMKMVSDDPVGFAIEKGQNPPAPLSFGNADAARAGVDERVRLARGVAADQQSAPGNPFRPADVASIAGAIANGKPEQAAVAFQALASVPDEMLIPALKNDAIKSAVTGAVRSTDFARFGAAMEFMDRMWKRAPETAKSLFGEDSIHDLMTWQSNLRYMTADQLAKDREHKALDPQVRERQKAAINEGREIAGKMDANEVVSKFDNSWWITPGPIARNLTGTQPLAPTDPLTRDALLGDFREQFGRRYAETLDKDKAAKETVELMKTKWARSEVNGGRLMLNAPETLRDANGQAVYPAINGRWDWMTKQVEGAIAEQIGKPISRPFEYGQLPNWSYTLIPDRQTQSEAQAGKPASYLVQVTDAETGKVQIMPRRFAFDPTEAVAKDRARFDGEFQRRRVLEQQIVENPFTALSLQVAP